MGGKKAQMSYLFGSDEWVKAFMKEINSSTTYKESSTDWEADFYFVGTPDKMLDEAVIYYMDLWHGECRDAMLVVDESQYNPAYRIETSDINWRKLVMRELDPKIGIVTGKIKVRGNKAQVLRYIKSALELVDCATRVPTEFPPEK
jgi:putative sterol carrier protein